MKAIKEAILREGKALSQEVLLVDTFLNHQVDVSLMQKVGEEFAAHFKDMGITRVMTIESSGIAPAAFTAMALGVPLVIMKKQSSRVMKGELLQTTVRSFTKGKEYELTVKRDFLGKGEKVLFVDDFLAYGEAAFGARTLIEEAEAQLAGIGIVIEKSFQPGRGRLEEAGIPVYSLARIAAMEEGCIEFLPDD